jgi:hypothetical protein
VDDIMRALPIDYIATTLLIFGCLGILSVAIPRFRTLGPLITCVAMVIISILLFDAKYHIFHEIVIHLAEYHTRP